MASSPLPFPFPPTKTSYCAGAIFKFEMCQSAPRHPVVCYLQVYLTPTTLNHMLVQHYMQLCSWYVASFGNSFPRVVSSLKTDSTHVHNWCHKTATKPNNYQLAQSRMCWRLILPYSLYFRTAGPVVSQFCSSILSVAILQFDWLHQAGRAGLRAADEM